MDFIKLPEFLKLFHSTNDSITFNEFIEIAKVRVHDNIIPLKKYMSDKKISQKDIRLLFENIQSKYEYLTRFYTMSLRIQTEKTHFHDMAPMKLNKMNNNEEVLFKNLIRNLHYRHILQYTESGCENNSSFLKMLFELYKKNIIDYKILTPSGIFYMKEGRLGSVFSSFYFRASIMNPYLVYSINKTILKGKRIFTPTLGWTSYAYGFLECQEVVEYVGTDVIPDVCDKTRNFIKSHSPKLKNEIFCKPSETLMKSKIFQNNYHSHFDVVFFSPPYYRLELYKGEQQSTTHYKTYEEWLNKYWRKTIELCHFVLQSGGKMCYILSGYGSENAKEQYDLLSDMNSVAEEYFTLNMIKPMHNKDVHVTKHKETAEKIMVFTKK
jgi:hypothetical protein